MIYTFTSERGQKARREWLRRLFVSLLLGARGAAQLFSTAFLINFGQLAAKKAAKPNAFTYT